MNDRPIVQARRTALWDAMVRFEVPEQPARVTTTRYRCVPPASLARDVFVHPELAPGHE